MSPARRPTDNAVFGPLTGGSPEPTYGGVLSFMRRRYSRQIQGVDVVVWGVPFDAATSNRPGARFGPQAIRRASAILDGDPQYPFGLDPFERLTVVDWGDCALDYGRPASRHRGDRRPGRRDSRRPVPSLSRSAATIRSRSACCVPTPPGTGRWRWCSSMRTRIPGTPRTPPASTMAASPPAPSPRGWSIPPARSRSACAPWRRPPATSMSSTPTPSPISA